MEAISHSQVCIEEWNFNFLADSLAGAALDVMSLLQRFVVSFQNEFSFKDLGSDSDRMVFVRLIIERLRNNSWGEKLPHGFLATLCDVVRFCARNPVGLAEVFEDLGSLTVVVNLIDASNADTEQKVAGLRCLTNVLFNCPPAFKLFTSKAVLVERIAYLLKASRYEEDVAFQVVKLLFLISAQSLDCLEPRVRVEVISASTSMLASLTTGSSLENINLKNLKPSSRLLAKEICKLLTALKISEVSCEGDVDLEESLVESRKAILIPLSRILSARVHDDKTFSFVNFLDSFDSNSAAVLDESTAELDDVSKDLLDMKKLALQVAMYCGSPLAASLVAESALLELCYFLGLQLARVEASSLSEDVKVSILVPPLAVLTAAATDSLDARSAIKAMIFPNAPPSVKAQNFSTQEASEELMHARDAPKGTLRGMLIKLMTSLSHHVKRTASELLFILCDEQGEEFVLRTGYGNAVAQLQLKGLIGNLPQS